MRRGLSRGGYGSAVSGSAEGGHDPAVLRGSPVPPRARWHSLTMPESILLAWSLHAFLSQAAQPRGHGRSSGSVCAVSACVCQVRSRETAGSSGFF